MTPDRVVSIHQPDFFPWLGVFNKALQSDILVLLDHVTNNPKSGIWTKRVRVLWEGEQRWITIPLVHPKPFRFLEIREMQIDDKDRRYAAAHRMLVQCYARAPFAADVREAIGIFFDDPDRLIAARNSRVLQWLLSRLGLAVELRSSSEIQGHGSATELLVTIVQQMHGRVYLHGVGAMGYQQDDLFQRAGIGLQSSGWPPWTYPQFNSGDWVPGLSVLDAVANCGFDQLGEMMRTHRAAMACRDRSGAER